MSTYILELDENDVMIIGGCLRKLPFEQVAALINKITDQLMSQDQKEEKGNEANPPVA